LKPSQDTPVTGGLLIAKIFEEAGLPGGVLKRRGWSEQQHRGYVGVEPGPAAYFIYGVDWNGTACCDACSGRPDT
jgi:hypothetical protein